MIAARRIGALLALGTVLAACAADRPSPRDPDAPVPRRAWLPAGEVEAVVLALHGFNDHANAFAEVATHARRRGIAVHAYDQRGFGANPGAGRWPGQATLVADLRDEIGRVRALHPERPLFVLGESMGAAVVIAAAAEAPLDVDGTILSAPAVWGGDQLNLLYRATLWLTARVVPGLKLTGESAGVLASDNLEMLRALGADPLFIKETRVDSIAGLVALMDHAQAEAGRLPGPLLVLGGARDEVVPPAAHQAMLERLRATPCLEVVYPEGYHMLLRDRQRQVVWDDILAWIAGRPLPSGLARPCGDSLSPVVAGRG